MSDLKDDTEQLLDEQISYTSRDEINFLHFVRMNRSIGYGRMMQIIAFEWDRVQPGGAHITCSGLGSHEKKFRERYFNVREADELFRREKSK